MTPVRDSRRLGTGTALWEVMRSIGVTVNICYLYVAGGFALARQFMVILASGASSG